MEDVLENLKNSEITWDGIFSAIKAVIEYPVDGKKEKKKNKCPCCGHVCED